VARAQPGRQKGNCHFEAIGVKQIALTYPLEEKIFKTIGFTGADKIFTALAFGEVEKLLNRGNGIAGDRQCAVHNGVYLFQFIPGSLRCLFQAVNQSF
jgi:hypothetical protein